MLDLTPAGIEELGEWRTGYTVLPAQASIVQAAAGDPANAAALATLRREADDCLAVRAPSVLDKTMVPASGDRRDFVSLSVYCWPVEGWVKPHTYRTRDGHPNPERWGSEYDIQAYDLMKYLVQTLCYGYAATGDERYAAKAGEVLRTWFTDPRTAMNPNFKYAQYIPGHLCFDTVFPAMYVPGAGGSGETAHFSALRGGVYVSAGGVIECSRLITIPDCAELLAGSRHWTADDDADLRMWFGALFDWLRTSTLGHWESYAPANHGSWYWAYCARFAEFTGRTAEATAILRERFPQRIRDQIDADGRVEDVRRSRSFTYGVFTVTSFVNAALIGDRLGVDLWHHLEGGVAKIPQAIDWLASRLLSGEPWPHPNIDGLRYEQAAPLLAIAARRLGRQDYAEYLARMPDYAADHRWRFVYPGVGQFVAAASGSLIRT